MSSRRVPSSFSFLKSNTFAILVLAGIFVASRSMTVLNRFYHARARKRMPFLEVFGDALFDGCYDAAARALVLRKRAF